MNTLLLEFLNGKKGRCHLIQPVFFLSLSLFKRSACTLWRVCLALSLYPMLLMMYAMVYSVQLLLIQSIREFDIISSRGLLIYSYLHDLLTLN